ncbi:MAG: hypothetical protein JWP28_2461 [Phenylobacterium sp.]|uniref:hypothetical protein n=1 Tax=Phenylobacterium sp. TaxID=1871053 RepID=UPI00262DF6C8|nr:hypothetical protein [Phenylobacterium sp.]MDB5498430.1 hypothetical protein [Phenylobacterium sp.]
MVDAARRRWIAGTLSLAGSAAAIGQVSCAKQAAVREVVRVREAVLGPGERITATNKFGTISMSYVSERERKFEFDGRTAIRKLIARPDRFMGMLGLYDPAGAWVFAPPKYRLMVEEAERHFDNYNQIYAALYESSAVVDWVYTGDGFVMGYDKVLPPPDHRVDFDTYTVDLYQFYLKGAKPTGLRGARDLAIRLERHTA